MNFAFIRKSLRRPSWFPPRRDPRHLLGRRGERVAARHLKRRGYRVLARNYRCPAGEIDLICSDGDMFVFVEVKTRSSDRAQDLHEAIHPAQWRRIEQAARFFVLQATRRARPCRFDVVTVCWPTDGLPAIEHFENAFEARRP